MCVLHSEQDGNYQFICQSDNHSREWLASVMLIFWLRDKEDGFCFPFMYLKFWLQANLEIQYTSRFLLCFIVFYFIFCPARIISYRIENIVETDILGEIFPFTFFSFIICQLQVECSALGFLGWKRNKKIKGQKTLQGGEAAPHDWNIVVFLGEGRRHQPSNGLNANNISTLWGLVP